MWHRSFDLVLFYVAGPSFVAKYPEIGLIIRFKKVVMMKCSWIAEIFGLNFHPEKFLSDSVFAKLSVKQPISDRLVGESESHEQTALKHHRRRPWSQIVMWNKSWGYGKRSIQKVDPMHLMTSSSVGVVFLLAPTYFYTPVLNLSH